MSLQLGIHFLLYGGKGCKAKCVDDFQYLLDLTGWSKEVLFAVFFLVIFVVLIGSVLLFHKFRKKRKRKYK
ncbi:MAG: hypothetical protein V3U71_05235 [Cocleimonas sp.]